MPWAGRDRSVAAMPMPAHDVILVPGAVLPADLAYGALLEQLGDDVNPVTKELEVYAGDAPPPGYTLDVEVAGILRTAESAGLGRFHLVGYSAGGAASLAFAAALPDRVRSVALIEPAWAGNERIGAAEAAARRRLDRIMALPPAELMPAFVRANLRPGVEPPPPPPGPTPPWMAIRPAGLRALVGAFMAGDLDLGTLGRSRQPVYLALGGLSDPDYYGKMAERLARVFGDFTLERFEERHHFDPPHRIEPERLAASLRDLWARAGAARYIVSGAETPSSPSARAIVRRVATHSESRNDSTASGSAPTTRQSR